MGKNNKEFDILKNWEEQVKVYPRLNIDEARDLYIKAINTVNEDEKTKLMNKVIEGTLYVIVNYVRSNKLGNINNVSYDVGDIINTCNELWVKEIYDGALLKVDAFSKILKSSFVSKLSQILNETSFTATDVSLFTSDIFVNILFECINHHKIYGKLSFKEFCEIVANYFNIKDDNFYPQVGARLNDLGLSDAGLTKQTYELIEYIIDSIKDKNDDINLSRTKISNYLALLIDTGIQGLRVNLDLVYENDFADILTKNMVLSDFVEDAFSCEGLDDRKKDILNRFYELHDYEKQDVNAIADVHGLSKARTYEIRNKAIRLIRGNSKMLKYYKFYKEDL